MAEKFRFCFSGEEAESKEQALESAKTSAISNLSLTRTPTIDDCKFCVERGFKYGYEYAKKEKGGQNETEELTQYFYLTTFIVFSN